MSPFENCFLLLVPRKAEAFQLDIYPDTPGPYPALSPDEWISGIDRDPILVSMKDRIEGTNMPKITTYRTLDTTPVHSIRGTPQRAVQPPIAEVAPTPKQNLVDHSPPSPMSIEKLAVNMQQQQQQQQQYQQPNNKGLRKIESLKMPATSSEFNNVR